MKRYAIIKIEKGVEMEQQNNKNGVNLLLVVITIALAILCILFATGTINFKSGDECIEENTSIEDTTETSKSNVVGTYTAKFENLKGDGDMNTASITLNLYENGVFTYVFSQYAPIGVLGNYTIEDNKIILNNWFNSNSGTGLNITKGTKTLIINSDGSITDNSIKNKSLVDNEITTANLIKGDSQAQFDLGNRLSAACLSPRSDGSCGAEPSEPSM